MASVRSSDKRSSVCSEGTSAREKNRLRCYRTFCYHLSTSLRNEDLEALKYLYLGIVSRANMEKVTTGFQLFDLLEQIEEITPQNLTRLGEMMQEIKRDDLASKVNKFMKDKFNEMKFDGRERQSCWKYASLVVCPNVYIEILALQKTGPIFRVN